VEAPLFAFTITKEVGVLTIKHSGTSSCNDDVCQVRSGRLG